MPYGDLDVYVEGALNIKDTSYIGMWFFFSNSS